MSCSPIIPNSQGNSKLINKKPFADRFYKELDSWSQLWNKYLNKTIILLFEVWHNLWIGPVEKINKIQQIVTWYFLEG